MNKYRFKFRTVLTLFSGIVLLSIVASQFYFHYRTSRSISDDFQADTIRLFESNIVSMLSFPVAISDRSRVNQIISDVSKIDFVYYVEVFDGDGELLARAVNGNVPVEQGIPIVTKTISLTQDVLNDFDRFSKHANARTVVGVVVLATTTHRSTKKFSEAMFKSAWVTVGICIAAFLVILFFVLKLERFVRTVLDSLEKISNQRSTKVASDLRTTEFNDISNGINKLSEKLSVTLSNLHTSDKYKKMILDVISHELRQPINAIDPILKLLTSSEDIRGVSPTMREHLRICAAASDQLIKILDRVVDFSLINEGNIPVKHKTINMEAFFDNLEKANTGVVPKGIEFKVTYIGNDQPCEIVTDEGRLIGIVSNLVTNALKFTSKGSVSVFWNIVSSATGEDLEIEVADTGVGISQDSIIHIFLDYYQGTSRKEGLGIGLSLVRAFVDDLGGEIQVNSKLGIGTKFDVRIPVEIASANDLHIPVTAAHDGLKAVVIDDNWSNGYSLRSVLGTYGVDTEIFVDPFEAIDELYTNEYDVVFVDYWMPQMTGVQLSNKLLGRDLFVVVVTAHVSKEVLDEIEKSISEGIVNTYIRKPITESAVREALGNVARNNDVVRRIIEDMQNPPRS